MKLRKNKTKKMSPEEAKLGTTGGLSLSELRRLSIQLKVNVGKKGPK
jgi:hypothetical protein